MRAACEAPADSSPVEDAGASSGLRPAAGARDRSGDAPMAETGVPGTLRAAILPESGPDAGTGGACHPRRRSPRPIRHPPPQIAGPAAGAEPGRPPTGLDFPFPPTDGRRPLAVQEICVRNILSHRQCSLYVQFVMTAHPHAATHRAHAAGAGFAVRPRRRPGPAPAARAVSVEARP